VKNWQVLVLLAAIGFAAPRKWRIAAVAVVLVAIDLLAI
jgi:hypothetical protein